MVNPSQFVWKSHQVEKYGYQITPYINSKNYVRKHITSLFINVAITKGKL